MDNLSQEEIIYIIKNVEYIGNNSDERRNRAIDFILNYTGVKEYGIDFLDEGDSRLDGRRLINISIGDHLLGCYFTNENAYKTHIQEKRHSKINQLIDKI